MKQMLYFDWQLLIHKRSHVFFLGGICLAYLVLGLVTFGRFPIPAVVSSVIFASVTIYCVMGILCCHSLSNNITSSNYSLCIYFPTKRNSFFMSKNIFTLLVLCSECLITVGITYLSGMIYQVSVSRSTVILQMVGIGSSVAIISGVALLTCTSGRGFQIGTVFVCTVVGMVVGGLSGAMMHQDGEFHSKGFLILLLCNFGFWLISNVIAQWIARKVTV